MTFRTLPSVLGKRTFQDVYSICLRSPRPCNYGHFTTVRLCRQYATVQDHDPRNEKRSSSQSISLDRSSTTTSSTDKYSTSTKVDGSSQSTLSDRDNFDWEHDPDLTIQKFSDLPSKNFGVNQHILINEEFKEALRQILWQFKAPIRYAFAYGSGVFPQSSATTGSSTLHPSPPEAINKVQGGNQKMIDFIFGVSYSQHWHSLNIQQYPQHYSALRHLGSYAVSKIQDSFGAGCYFNPYITINGVLIKYGVVNIDTLCRDLSEWDTLYLAGRLQKPVKILRDNPSVRLANQVNLISAVRTALLLLPEKFTEKELYTTITGISYKGDPRMSIGGDDPRKVSNIVNHQMINFRQLYAPLVENLPNINFNDPACSDEGFLRDPSANANLVQNMDPVTRGHMVRRLPRAFREKLYFEYRFKYKIPGGEFKQMMQKVQDEDPERIRRREGGEFEQRIAKDVGDQGLRLEVSQVIEKTIARPSTTQSIKSIFTAGFRRSWRYATEKRQKAKAKPNPIEGSQKETVKGQSDEPTTRDGEGDGKKEAPSEESKNKV